MYYILVGTFVRNLQIMFPLLINTALLYFVIVLNREVFIPVAASTKLFLVKLRKKFSTILATVYVFKQNTATL